MKKYIYKIEGLDCAACALELEEKISKLNGVENVSISFFSEKLIFEIDPSQESDLLPKIKKTIKKSEPDATIKEL